MAEPRFNPSHTVEFDFTRGTVAVGPSALRVLLPADLLRDLVQKLPEASLVDLGRRLGTELGRRVAERLGPAAADGSIESIVEHLGGEIALCGMGSLALERWGRALVLMISGSPLMGAGDALLARILEGALQRLFARDTRAIDLGRRESTARFLILNPRTARLVNDWLGAGVTWGDVLGRLQDGHAPAGGAG